MLPSPPAHCHCLQPCGKPSQLGLKEVNEQPIDSDRTWACRSAATNCGSMHSLASCSFWPNGTSAARGQGVSQGHQRQGARQLREMFHLRKGQQTLGLRSGSRSIAEPFSHRITSPHHRAQLRGRGAPCKRQSPRSRPLTDATKARLFFYLFWMMLEAWRLKTGCE